MGNGGRADLPEVRVEDGDLNGALRRFFRRWKTSNIAAELRFRTDNPTKSARRKAKARKALRRYRKQVKTISN